MQAWTNVPAMREPRATIDFETRSAGDIRNGAWLYAKHPTTRILCLSFMLPGDEEASLWVPRMDGHRDEESRGRPVEDLFDWIRKGGLVEAHNVFFERCVWHHLATKPPGSDENGATGMGAPAVKETQWRCSAAKAAACALPRGLDGAGQALGLSKVKDVAASRIMLKLSKPRKRRKADTVEKPVYFHTPSEVPEDFETMYRYCQDDVLAEHALSDAIPDLSPFEYKVWLADFRANWRGVRVDIELVKAAIDLDQKVKAELNRELKELTGIDSGTKRRDILEWLTKGPDLVDIDDTAAPTLDWLMEQPVFQTYSAETQRVVFIARNINRTSVTKYVRILKCRDPDDNRVRELVMYHGAATGRWSGKGIQVQNFPRGVLYELTGAKTTSMTQLLAWAVEDIKTRDLGYCQAMWGDVLALLSSALRGALVPSQGRVFYVADYSAIEARIVLWLAEATEALEVFRRGDDIYCDMASALYRRVITKADKLERQFGKVTILGLGYGMGFLTFLLNLRSYGIKFTPEQVNDILGKHREKLEAWVRNRLWPTPPDPAVLLKMEAKERAKAMKEFDAKKRQANKDLRRLTQNRENPEAVLHELALCKFTVDTYRKRYAEVPQMWKDQEAAAVEAVRLWILDRRENPKSEKTFPIQCGKVTWVVEGRWLLCYLPSGRALKYCDPTLKAEATPWGGKRHELRYMGVHKKTKRWTAMGTYGGSIVENIDQATARDMMAWAMVAADEDEFYDPIATIHDELLAEADDDGVDHYEEFEQLMVSLPDCFDGCPVAAEGARLYRYQK